MKYFRVLAEASLLWSRLGMGHYAAAFSYYAPFALIPLVLVSVGVASFFYGTVFVKNIFQSWGTVLGSDLLELIDVAVKNLDIEVHTYQIPLLGVLFFCSISILAFNALASGFETISGMNSTGWRSTVRQSIRSISFVIILQIYIVTLLGIEGVLATIAVSGFISLFIWFFSISAVFMLFYRFLTANAPSVWSCVVGGMTAGLLFIFAKNLVGLYLAAKPVLTIFGAAGLILVLLIWVYVLAAIVYFGAIVAHLYDKQITK